jgi:hypothetical protein
MIINISFLVRANIYNIPVTVQTSRKEAACSTCIIDFNSPAKRENKVHNKERIPRMYIDHACNVEISLP